MSMTIIDENTSFADLIEAKGDIVSQKQVLNAELKILKEKESDLDYLLQKDMDANGVTFIKNGTARVSITESIKAKIDDFDLLRQHILNTESFELLNRAINTKAYQERLKMGEEVPGLSPYVLRKVNYGKT